ncbi:MAG: galactose-1-phosphate uridylyltransferase [Desulfosarcinaceae bacterium]
MLMFRKQTIEARIIQPDGKRAHRPVEIRSDPITGRTCRITYSRSAEREPGTATLPAPPPAAADTANCPFCPQNLAARTPRLPSDLCPQGRLQRAASILFPNLYPYGQYSAVSLLGPEHFVEIGTANPHSYAECFLNCRDYLRLVQKKDPDALHLAITQNHLPSAGGSLVHPHLQIQADHTAANYQRHLRQRAGEYRQRHGEPIFSAYLRHERDAHERWIGTTGDWQWLSAFAPEGFYEIWGILPGATGIREVSDENWQALAEGVINAQKYYRSLGRNGYNLGMLFREDSSDDVEVRVVIKVRANYAPWVRSDFTGFELMLGDMATFTAPEQVAAEARTFWGEAALGAGHR